MRRTGLPETLVDQLRAFAVAAPRPFAFSHVTAARLLGIPVPLALEDDGLVHIITPTSANRVRRAEVSGHRGLESRSVVQVQGLPVVDAADTWVDLGEYVGPGRPVGLDDLIAAGDAALNLVGSEARLREALERRVRPRGKVTLSYARHRVRPRAWSPMETRSRLMVVRAGLPEPTHNADVVSLDGDWLGLGDLVWAEQRVVGEYQGAQFHSRTRDRNHDRGRRRSFEAGDWTVVEIEAEHIFRAEARAAKLSELAGHLGISPHLVDVAGSAPQFLAPQQFQTLRRRRAR